MKKTDDYLGWILLGFFIVSFAFTSLRKSQLKSQGMNNEEIELQIELEEEADMARGR